MKDLRFDNSCGEDSKRYHKSFANASKLKVFSQ